MAILLLSGLPASGKSTYAHKWIAEDPDHRRRINWDDLRVEMFGCKGATYFSQPSKYVRECEAKVKEESEEIATNFLKANPIEHSVVIDNTNLTDRHKGIWQEIGRNLGVPVETHEMDTPVARCIDRDRRRKGDDRVGRAVIDRMALTTGWIDWNDEEIYSRQRFVIVDIDGTLSDATHRQHYVRQPPDAALARIGASGAKWHPNWQAFHAEVDKDPPKPVIVELVKWLSQSYHIIIVSGRSPDYGCGIKTEDWLDQHLSTDGIPGCELYEHLFMRAAGDTKPDYEHKQEILDLLPKHRIAFVLDDRDQVVRMWRKNGLTCLQCADGNF